MAGCVGRYRASHETVSLYHHATGGLAGIASASVEQHADKHTGAHAEERYSHGPRSEAANWRPGAAMMSKYRGGLKAERRKVNERGTCSNEQRTKRRHFNGFSRAWLGRHHD